MSPVAPGVAGSPRRGMHMSAVNWPTPVAADQAISRCVIARSGFERAVIGNGCITWDR